MRGEGNASLADEASSENPFSALPGAAAGGEPEKQRLSAIINRLNERHALNLTLTDALLFERSRGLDQRPGLEAAAKVKTYDNFVLVFAKRFFDTVFARMDANADSFKVTNDDQVYAGSLKDRYGRDMYEALRDAA